jgi:hypothetical protein
LVLIDPFRWITATPVVKERVVVVVMVGLRFGVFFVSFGWDVGGVRGVLLDGCRWLFGFCGSRTV